MEVGYADPSCSVLAPDGIEIVPIALPGLRHLTVVEGRIPPGRYQAHFHYSIEQVTYVLDGELVVTTWDADRDEAVDLHLRAGGAIPTAPLQTLAFANPAEKTARVLFITAPPYPQDNSDTRLVGRHGPGRQEDVLT